MPRANRHFLPGHVWHITHRYPRKVCSKRSSRSIATLRSTQDQSVPVVPEVPPLRSVQDVSAERGFQRSRVPVVPIVPAIKRRAQRDQTFSEIRDQQQLTNSIRPIKLRRHGKDGPVGVSAFRMQYGYLLLRCREKTGRGRAFACLDQPKHCVEQTDSKLNDSGV
jgi:hypothetical protein